MKRKKKYRPKPILTNPVGYVLEGMAPVAEYGEYLVDLQIKHHRAVALLVRGEATRSEMDILINAANVADALVRLGFGGEYGDVLKAGQSALYEVASRGAGSGRFILRGEEMGAINALIDLHDAQLGVLTVKDVDRAITLVERERRAQRMTKIKTKGAT